ncbi:MAG: hypothetical protein WEE69_07765, partial [Acidimicrobiia bacterium]
MVRAVRGRWRASSFVAAAVVLIGAFVWVPAVRSTAAEGSRRSTQADRPLTVVYYGDSLTRGSFAHVEERVSVKRPSWRVVNRAFSGTAICDWFEQMHEDARLEPDLVVLQFSGNAFTPCMEGIALGSEDLLNKYRTDADFAAGFWTARGADVMFVGSPRDVDGSLLAGPHPLDLIYRGVAQGSASEDVSFSDGPERALAISDPSDPSRLAFPRALPCLPGEVGLASCVDGSIQVRAPDDRHFCPVADSAVYPCPVYSSGGVRFGVAL